MRKVGFELAPGGLALGMRLRQLRSRPLVGLGATALDTLPLTRGSLLRLRRLVPGGLQLLGRLRSKLVGLGLRRGSCIGQLLLRGHAHVTDGLGRAAHHHGDLGLEVFERIDHRCRRMVDPRLSDGP